MGRHRDGISTVTIIGMGLMGGSFGMACLAKGLAVKVVGYDKDPAATEAARVAGAITEGSRTAAFAVKEADLVVLATPVGVIPEVFAEIVPFLKAGCMVTDLGSTKAGIVEQVTAAAPSAVHFVGGHPVTGSENHGIESATAELYQGCLWILTPDPAAPEEAVQALRTFLQQLGAKILVLDPARHDEALALTSHLPQVLSSTLMAFAADVATAGDGMPLLAAGGFRDMTRIAASSSQMWVDIIRENRPALLSLMRKFQDALGGMVEAVDRRDWDSVRSRLDQAREVRRALPVKAGLDVADMQEVLVSVPDRTGVLAEVSTILREAGVNIEDLNIVHLPEGGRGVLHVAVSGGANADRAVEALAGEGFTVQRL